MSFLWVRKGILCGMLVFAFNANAATISEIDAAHIKGLKWLLTQQDGEGDWDNSISNIIIATTSSLEALNRAGIQGYPYAKGISWLTNAAAVSTDAAARQAISLYKAGINTSALVTRLVSWRNDESFPSVGIYPSWGSYDHYSSSFPDTSLALDAIKITGTVYPNAGDGISFITSSQNADGGWSYAKSEVAVGQRRVIPTAYNALTLNRYKVSYSVQTNINNAITWLKSQQKTGGGFGEGTNGTVLETALAYQAIVAEKGTADPAAISAQDFLIVQQSADGSWGADAFTTAQALLTFPITVLPDGDKDGIPDEVETLMGTNAYVADSRWLAQGNGESVTGVTTPLELSSTSVFNQPFSFTLGGTGTGPFTWKITSGALPPGLSLNGATGVISGTPSAVGSYSFEYTVTDANGISTSVVAQIDVLLTSPGAHDGDLNGDAIVDAADVAMAERIALGLITPTPDQLTHADVAPNGIPDGVIDAADVSRIRRKALGLETF